MKTLFRRAPVAALLVLFALVAAACGGQDEPALTPPASDEATAATDGASSAAFNEADITFVQGMIPHHEQATEMAQLIPERTERQELLDLGTAIIDAQTAEIDEMRQMLDEAGAPETADAGHEMGGSMDSDIAELEQLEGDEFDLAFIDAMTAHHQTAIDMAGEVLEAGENAQVADLANRIIAAQQAEIEQMAAWRAEWAS